MTQEKSKAIADRLGPVPTCFNLSGLHHTHGKRVLLVFDDREKQTILTCLDDGMLYRGGDMPAKEGGLVLARIRP